MATIVKVAVPKYTPANLEVCTPATAAATTLTEITHTGDLSVTKDVPEGYYSKTRVYIDLGSSDNHRFDPNTAAYRDVAVMVGVPVDMGMSVDQPTIDLGAVTAGFADQVIQSGTSFPWEPYRRSTAALGDPTQFAQSSEIFGQYYQPITVRNNGNVNLMNVHVDSNVYLDGATAPQSYVRLTSDQAETPYPTATALEPSNWTDSLSFIPSIDPSTDLLLNDTTDTNGGLTSAQLAGHRRLPAQPPGAGPERSNTGTQPYASTPTPLCTRRAPATPRPPRSPSPTSPTTPPTPPTSR